MSAPTEVPALHAPDKPDSTPQASVSSFPPLSSYPASDEQYELMKLLAEIERLRDTSERDPLRQAAEVFLRMLAREEVQRETVTGELLAALRKAPLYEGATEDELNKALCAAIKAAEQNMEPDGSPLTTSWAEIGEVLGDVKWAWPGWLPTGMLTMLASEPGQGKSSFALRLAGSYLRGDAWPDGARSDGRTGRVLWCECEGAQQINFSRARSWGLPLDKIVSPGEVFSEIALDSEESLAKIRRIVERRGDLRFIVVDSLRASHGGNENSSDCIAVVKALAILARDTGLPILLTHHLRKRHDSEGAELSLDRLRGTSAISQLSRVIMAIDAPDSTRPEDKRLLVIKSNLAKFPAPVGFRLTERGVEFMEAPKATDRSHPGQIEMACDLLCELLQDGPRVQKDLEAGFAAAGVKWCNAQKARERLGISTRKLGGRGEPWEWRLP